MSNNDTPKSVLFVCNMNQIRSPMAEFLTKDIFGDRIYAQSAGIFSGDEDGFMHAVMQERSIDASSHEPETLAQLEDAYVDLVITLTTQAHEGTLEFFKDQPSKLNFGKPRIRLLPWETGKIILSAYRKTRNQLEQRIRERFGSPSKL